MSLRLTVVIACLFLLVMSACGGNGNPAAPTSPAQQPYNQTLTGTVSNFGVTYHSLQIPRSGNLTLRLTWPDSTLDVDLYLTVSGCDQIYGPTACNQLAGSNNSTGTSETIARTVNSGENFTIFVDNLHRTRSTTYTLTLNIQ